MMLRKSHLLLLPVLVFAFSSCMKKKNAKAEEDDDAFYSPRISNNIIVFDAEEAGVFDLYSVLSDGTELTNLTNTPSIDEQSPAISHDGLRIAFQKAGKLVHTNFEMADEVQLNNGAFSSGDFTPHAISWSAKSYYLTFHDADNEPNVYYVHSKYNTEAVEVFDRGFQRLDSGTANYASLSPENNALCYVKNIADVWFGLEMGTTGGYGDDDAPVVVYSNEKRILSPRFSKDGTRIAFGLENAQNGIDICVIDTDGTDFTVLTEGTSDLNFSPCFSPDDSQLVYISNKGTVGGFDVFVMNADGSGAVNITNTSSRSEMSPFWN